ncbi:uncharacterized protein BJ212DRAFT_1487497 [Suillus subaureus]|uniref:Uncharacterized protein n=1 Tax=Suillus subaureus TaxID=48587 RepID=A0A9P7DSA8_9AGAM|nr:uncharacterized protein BJ212DRAFT_1487497 [Suillus subaureus]KAG1801941.1 hypothetical protein BJ212DRAFT_1487497 [Suillus subaureus]
MSAFKSKVAELASAFTLQAPSADAPLDVLGDWGHEVVRFLSPPALVLVHPSPPSTTLQLPALLWLRKKYNKFNKALKQSGAGMTYEDLQKDPETKTLIDSQLKKFPWWPDLHSWWRTNPAFNTTSSSADPRQNFESNALQYFSRSGSNNAQVPDENDPDIDDELELEEGEVDETKDTYREGLDPVLLADKIVEEPIDEDTIMMGPTDQSITHGSTSAIFPPFLCLRPPITPISIYPSDQNIFSLNSPEPLPDDSNVQSDSCHSFFSGLKKSASSCDATPQDSEDSDISASHAMQGLHVNSCHASPSIWGCSAVQVMKLSGTSPQSGSPQSSHPPSHKCTNNSQTSIATEHLSETADVLI